MKNELLKSGLIVLVLALASACSSNDKKVNEPALQAAKAGMRFSQEGQILTMNDLLFDTNRSSLENISNDVVMQATRYLEADAGRKAILKGYTDSTGSDDENHILSTHRAFNVRNALIAQGIDASRLEVVPMGEANPVASNESAEGRKYNRRVEIVFPY